MGYHRTYGLGCALGQHSPNVGYENGEPVDLTCPGRKPIGFNAAGVPIWSMTGTSAFYARPVLDPGKLPCGAQQVKLKVSGIGKAIGVMGDIAKQIPLVTAVSVGAVALSSMGAGVVKAGSGVLTNTAAKSGTVATGGLFDSIKATSNKILGFVNQGRTVAAIANGEIPPPPVSLTGNSFLEWAFNVGKDELVKKYQRNLTRAEEEALAAEIRAMQNQLAATTPVNLPKTPSPAMPVQVQERQQTIVIENKKQSEDMTGTILMIALPALAILAMK